MANSEAEICSNALRLLGDKPITSLDDGTERANLCKALYPKVRDRVLRSGKWNCATKRIKLAPLATAPDFEYANQFELPSDCLRPISVYEADDDKWVVENGRILTDLSTVQLIYITRVTDPTKFDALLEDAIEARLAAELAVPLTGKREIADQMWALLDAKLREARVADGQEGTPPEIEANELINARR